MIIMDFASKRAALAASHQAELAKLEKEEAVHKAFADAGLPEPHFVCIHSNHASVKWYADPKAYGYQKNFSVEAGISMLEKLEPFLLNMEPARDGVSLSIWPARVRSGDKWVSDGVPFAADLRQHLFGVAVGDSHPAHRNVSLSMWAIVGGLVVDVEIELQSIPSQYMVRWLGLRDGFRKPHIPGSRMVSYGGGERNSADVHYLFQSLADVREALVAKAAA